MVGFGTKQVLGLFPQPHVLLGQLFTRQAHVPLQHTFLLLHHSFVLKDLSLLGINGMLLSEVLQVSSKPLHQH